MDYRMREAIGKAHGYARLDEDGRLAVSVAADLTEARRDAAKAIDAYWGMLTELRDSVEYGEAYAKRKALGGFVSEAKAAWRGKSVDVGDFGVRAW